MSDCIPVGGLEIADRIGVRRETVAQWKQRGLLPSPRWTVSGEDAWDWSLDIEPWARETGRMPGRTVPDPRGARAPLRHPRAGGNDARETFK